MFSPPWHEFCPNLVTTISAPVGEPPGADRCVPRPKGLQPPGHLAPVKPPDGVDAQVGKATLNKPGEGFVTNLKFPA